MLLIQSTYSYVSTQINLGTAYNYCTSSQQIKIPLDDTSTNEVIHPGLVSPRRLNGRALVVSMFWIECGDQINIHNVLQSRVFKSEEASSQSSFSSWMPWGLGDRSTWQRGEEHSHFLSLAWKESRDKDLRSCSLCWDWMTLMASQLSEGKEASLLTWRRGLGLHWLPWILSAEKRTHRRLQEGISTTEGDSDRGGTAVSFSWMTRRDSSSFPGGWDSTVVDEEERRFPMASRMRLRKSWIGHIGSGNFNFKEDPEVLWLHWSIVIRQGSNEGC